MKGIKSYFSRLHFCETTLSLSPTSYYGVRPRSQRKEILLTEEGWGDGGANKKRYSQIGGKKGGSVIKDLSNSIDRVQSLLTVSRRYSG